MMTLEELGKHAVEAEKLMKKLTGEQKQTGLLHAAAALRAHAEDILEENRKDMAAAAASGMPESLQDRLLDRKSVV